jgi:hypothetical protein
VKTHGFIIFSWRVIADFLDIIWKEVQCSDHHTSGKVLSRDSLKLVHYGSQHNFQISFLDLNFSPLQCLPNLFLFQAKQQLCNLPADLQPVDSSGPHAQADTLGHAGGVLPVLLNTETNLDAGIILVIWEQ